MSVPTAESVINKLQELIDTANATTGEEDSTLTDAIESLIAGYGRGSSGVNVAQGDFTTGTSSLRTVSLNCGFVPSKILIAAVRDSDTTTGSETLTSTVGGIASLYYCATDKYPFRTAYLDGNTAQGKYYISVYNHNSISSAKDQVSISNTNGVAKITFKNDYGFIIPYNSRFQWVAIE